MSAQLDERYFTWLYSQIASVELTRPSQSYWALARQLYAKEFVWFVPNDDNRIEDGRDLRREFLSEQRIEVDTSVQNWLAMGCSMLELMISLSRWLSFESEGEPRVWFWQLIHNINLTKYKDSRTFTRLVVSNIDDILNQVIHRQYHYSGQGGLFPLRNPEADQTQVELWYQLQAYLIELG